MIELRKKISEEIKASGIKQTEIAKKLNIRQQTINAYANAKLTPSLEVFAELCKILEWDANYILGLADYSGKKSTI